MDDSESKANESALDTLFRLREKARVELEKARKELGVLKARVAMLETRAGTFDEMFMALKPPAGFHPSFPPLGRYHGMKLTEAILELAKSKHGEALTYADARRELLANGLQTTARNVNVALYQTIGRLASAGKLITGADEQGRKIFRLHPPLAAVA